MAQYFWDFSDQAVDGAVPDGFTQRGEIKTAPDGFTVATGPLVRWESDGGANGYSILTPDVLGLISGNTEIYIEFEKVGAGQGGSMGGVVLRAQDTNPETNTYWVTFAGTNELVGGRIVAGAEDWNTATFAWSVDTNYGLRARIASNVLSFRAFTPGGAEGSYTTYTDGGSNFSSGRLGFLARGYNGPRLFRKLGIGTDDDPAPTAPVSGGSAGAGLAAKTAPIKSLVNGGLVAASRNRKIMLPPREIIVPRRAPLHLGRNFHSEARL